MASLPPRPETTSKPRDERRPPVDDRERDRLTASRLRPSERKPELERPYVPRKPDSYVPGGYDSRREPDRRDHGDRDKDRDRRSYVRERRDYDRSPRRRSPDRRPYDRDRSYRRSPSPYRRPGYGRRDSRSPPRYRRRSRTPPRQRPRSRSRSPRRPSPIRLGNHSIAPSPRERSPYRPSSHKARSRSSDRRLSKPPNPPRRSPPPDSGPQKNDAVVGQKAQADSHSTVEQKAARQAPSEGEERFEPSKTPVTDRAANRPGITSEIQSTSKPVKEETKDDTKLEKAEHPASSPALDRKVDQAENKMDIVVEPPSVAPAHTTPSTPSAPPAAQSLPSQSSFKASSVNEPPRGPSHAAQAQSSWQYPPKVPRSPPRGPRAYRPPAHPLPHTIPPREPRRHPGLPHIPKSERPKHIAELEQELSKYETLRRNYAIHHLNEVKELRRALHELDMTSIDLRAAENRHRIADLQLEKAKAGTLGIDAVDVIEV